MNVEKMNENDRAEARRAIDLAVKELVTTRGGQIAERGDERQFIVSLSREKSEACLRGKIKKYLAMTSDSNYYYKESGRNERTGNIRPTDLVIAGHFSSETQERFIVADLKGEIFDDEKCSSYVRFEAWCRMYYCPNTQRSWFVHYVDIIIRHKSPTQHALFEFEYAKSGNVIKATEVEPNSLCLFFETLQGGTWG
ncbi:MAG: hypothetical protein WCT16_03820 [Candidatus Buchananbacteria bacterium]